MKFGLLGNCLAVNLSDQTLVVNSCKTFLSGCPEYPYWTNAFSNVRTLTEIEMLQL